MKKLIIVAFCILSSFAHGENDSPADAIAAAAPTESRELLIQKQKELVALQNEVLKLGGTIDHPTRVRISLWALEVDRTRLRELKLPNPLTLPRTSIATVPSAQATSSESMPTGHSPISEEQLLQSVEPLIAKGIVRIKASPSVVTSLGQSTSVKCFREITHRNCDDQKSPGLAITVLPRQASEGRIRLELQVQIMEEDFGNSVTINGKIIPGLSSRRVQSHVELKLNDPFLLGGLIHARYSPENAAVTSETEFFLVATTSIVSADESKPPKD